MDSSDYLYVALFVYWVLSQILAVAKKAKKTPQRSARTVEAERRVRLPSGGHVTFSVRVSRNV